MLAQKIFICSSYKTDIFEFASLYDTSLRGRNTVLFVFEMYLMNFDSSLTKPFRREDKDEKNGIFNF